ncbi:MAG: hypothetical protein PHU56_01145 [Candidatus Pacebacteria bacterium]|nr:hypothetical protein [Candidatus Paceibacterota bacterium]
MEELKKLKQLIEKNQNFSLIFSQEKANDAVPAVIAFFYILKQSGKNASIIGSVPEKFRFLLATDNIAPHPGQAEPPAYIAFGISHFSELLPYFKTPPDTIVNIDIPENNENYGHLNLTAEDAPSLSELTLNIISFLDENLFSGEVATALLSGILYPSHSRPAAPLTGQTLQKIGFLIDQGATLKTIAGHIYGSEAADEKSLLIFEKILSKLNFSERRNTGWALLEKSAFREIGATIKNILFALKELASGTFPFENFFLLCEQGDYPVEIQGVFYSPEKRKLDKITQAMGGNKKGNGVLFQIRESSLQSVKNKILELLELN